MRTLSKVREFAGEASNALFNKQQAVTVTLRLLEMEANDLNNTPEESRILKTAISKAEFRYLDLTRTDTDTLLDSLGVARFTTQDIVSAVEDILFNAQ